MGYNPNIYIATNTGRGYLVSGSPLTDGASSGNTTVYFGGVTGSGTIGIAASSGTNITGDLFGFNELSISVSSMASGAYDFFVYPNANNVLTLGASAWASTTSPPTARKTIAGTNYNYLNTVNQRIVFSGYVSGGVIKDWTGSRWISNLQNKIMKPLFCCDSTASWSYASPTARAANSNFTEGAQRVSVFWADASGAIVLTNSCGNAYGSVTNSIEFTGIGVNSTTAFTVSAIVTQQGVNANLQSSATVNYASASNIGFNYFQRLEAVNTGTGVFYNNSGSSIVNAQSMSGFTYN